MEVPDTITCLSTKFRYTKATLCWTIGNFSLSGKRDTKYIHSGIFRNKYTKSEWIFMIYPHGEKEESEGQISFYLILQAAETAKVQAEIKVSFLNSSHSLIADALNLSHCFAKGDRYGFKKYTYGDIVKYLKDDIIKIRVAVYEVTDGFKLVKEWKEKKQATKTLGTELFNLQQNEKFCDLIIKAGEVEINVHRVVMAGASDVFKVMLGHETLESTTGRIDITDLDPETVKLMIQYIYNREEINWKAYDLHRCLDILRASDKYALDELKLQVLTGLKLHMTTDNICEILLAAHLHGGQRLKKKCFKFIYDYKLKLSDVDFKVHGAEIWRELAQYYMDYLKEM